MHDRQVAAVRIGRVDSVPRRVRPVRAFHHFIGQHFLVPERIAVIHIVFGHSPRKGGSAFRPFYPLQLLLFS